VAVILKAGYGGSGASPQELAGAVISRHNVFLSLCQNICQEAGVRSEPYYFSSVDRLLNAEVTLFGSNVV